MKYSFGILFTLASFTIAYAQNSTASEFKSALTLTLASNPNALRVLNGKILPRLGKSKIDTAKQVDPFTEIDPNDIDRINFINKDQARTLYGEPGKNGAIQVFTKKISRETMDPRVTEVWDLKPKKITPGISPGAAPSDAIILFDGKDLSNWATLKGDEAKWEVKDGAFTVTKGTGDIKTKQTFGDFQLHIEWRTPAEIVGEGQGRGNSGIFLQERYELQVLDSYESVTYSNGQAGSIYKQSIPLVNACLKPGEWQAYDVIYTAPRFSDNGRVIAPAYITVIHNGVVVQNHTQINGPTEFKGLPVYQSHGKGSIKLQDHGNPVSFRNIWIREL